MSTEKSNKGIIFAEVPTGLPELGKHFKWDERKIDLSSIVLEKGEILVKNLYMSLDPYMRGRMRPEQAKSYINPYKLGDIINVICVSVVVKSNHDRWKEGDFYFGFSGWEEYTKISSETANRGLFTKSSLKNAIDNGIPLSYFLGLLGMPGLTAYVGLFMIGKPKKGETIFISTAAGAVGQVVAQIAKIKGLKVVGSTGDDTKVDFLLNELKIDHAINYKKVDLEQALKEACPEGIDIYFDNVAGETLDIVLTQLNDFARVISCGMLSQYNATKPYGIKNLMKIIPKRVLIQGYTVHDHYKDYFESSQKDISQWLKEHNLKYKEYLVNGIENSPKAFLHMFEGKNFGKVIVKISDP